MPGPEERRRSGGLMVKIVGAPGYEDFEAVVIGQHEINGTTYVVIEDGDGYWDVFEEKYVKGTGSA